MPFTVEQHIALRRVSSITPSPDGSWLAVVVERLDREGRKYVSDLWRVPTDGGAATQLTRGDCRDASPRFRYDGALGFLSNRAPSDRAPDEGADRRSQIWLLPAAGGEPQQLTDEPLGVLAFAFAASADRMAFFAPVMTGVALHEQRRVAADREQGGPSARRYRRQPVRHWDHWLSQDDDRAQTHLVVCTASGEGRVDLTPDARQELSIDPHLDVIADGSKVAISWATPGEDREEDVSVLVIEVATQSRSLVPQPPNTVSDGARFSPDGTSLAMVRSTRSPERASRPTLTVVELASVAARDVAAEWDRWPSLFDWRPDGRALLVTADDDGLVPVFSVAVDSGEVTPLVPRESGGSHTCVVALDDERAACIRSRLLDAPECYVLDSRRCQPPRALARLSGFTPADEWAELGILRVESTDGAHVHGTITRPRGPEARPTLIWIHGGPHGMSGDGWHWRWNALLAVAQGYTVVQPNPRGSTGFGQAFVQGASGNRWGAQCYEDLMAVAGALALRPDVDVARLVAMGGSFGGYMTNWIGTQTDRFRCLITHASIATMSHFAGTTDHPPSWYLEMGGEDPYSDAMRFDRYAPIRHVASWTTPVLIIHGERDYRCPISEGLLLFEALQYHGVESELLVFPDENHWILRPRNIVAWYGAVLEFLARHLK